MDAIPKEVRKETVDIGSFRCESGVELDHVQICYESWGRLNDARDNVILITHSLTGTSHAASHGADDRQGWWEEMIGPGKPFDTDQYWIICSNVIGGCSGSTGPSSVNPATATPYGASFPVITIRDMVKVQRRLLKRVEISRLRSVSGGSMGGMQALEWGAMYPQFVDSVIPIAVPGRAYPQSIAFRKAQRRAIMMDPEWREGNYYGGPGPREGIEVARMMGFITYRSEREFSRRFGRRFVDPHLHDLTGRFEIEQYLEYHGKKLAEWFDANTYLYLSKAMDLHDLGYGCDSYEAGIRRIQAPVCMIGFDSDLLFPIYQQRELADILRRTNPNTQFHKIETLYGHDGFLAEIEQLSDIIQQFLFMLNPQLKGVPLCQY